MLRIPYAAAFFVVEHADVLPGLVHVGLVADDMAVLVDAASDLDAAVGRGQAGEAEAEFELEVAGLAFLPGDELVDQRLVIGGGLAGDGSVFNPPIYSTANSPSLEATCANRGVATTSPIANTPWTFV